MANQKPKNNNKVKTNKTDKKVETKKTTNNANKKVEGKRVASVNNKKKETITIKTEPKLVTKKAVEKEDTVKSNASKDKKSLTLNSKQKDVVLIVLVVVLAIVALLITSNNNKKVDVELPVTLEGTAGFTEITYSEYSDKLNEEKAFLVAIVKDGCGYCEAYEPIIEEVSKEYNIPIYYINLSNLTENEYTDLSKSNSYLRTNNWGTPTTLLLYGSTVVDSIGGYVEKESLVSFIDKNIKVDADAE